MKKLIYLLFLLPTLAQAADNFVPKDYFILKEAEGDLNKDGLKDKVLIVAPDWEKKEEMTEGDGQRTLLILLAQPDGKFALSASKGDFILGKWEGGVFGDPLQTLAIERGSIVVDIYGGSRDRWGMTYRFRWQNNDWYLIGYTSTAADTLELTSTTVDVNLSTGIIETTEMVKDESKKRSQKKNIKPISIKVFTPKLAEDLIGS